MSAPGFTCPRCGMTSHHPDDVREGYCGNCHDWTGDFYRHVMLAPGRNLATTLADGSAVNVERIVIWDAAISGSEG